MNFSAQHGRRLAFSIGMLVFLSGCASGADPMRMVVRLPPADSNFPAALQHSMCVRTVTGGEATNPLWVSKVSNQDFQSALAQSMDAAGLSASSAACKYPVDANLLGLAQPSIGFDLEVTSHVNYKVYDTAAQPVMLETISAAYTAKVSEAFAAVKRLQLANEGSIRGSITQFLEKLRAVMLPQATPSATLPVPERSAMN